MRRLIVIILAFPFIAVANNIETWNTVQVSKKIDNWTLNVSEESRIGVDQTQTTKKLDEFHTTVGASYALISHFSLGIQDDYVLLRNGSDARYRRDNRPGVNAAVHRDIKGFAFLNRSRFVIRDLEDERHYFRYRNLSKLMTPALCSCSFAKDIKLFSAYEWYFDEGSKDRCIRKNDKFCQFWTDFGVNARISKCISIDLFYRLIEVKSALSHDWSPGHAVCMSLNLTF